jgi:hypothetical protein
MQNSLSVQGSALKGIWFVVDNKTGERIAKCKTVVEAVMWANSYIDRKNGK